MVEKIISQIAAGEDVRGNISRLRRMLEEHPKDRGLCITEDAMGLWERCLADEDPKARKNTASLYRDLAPALMEEQRAQAAAVLYRAYAQEATLFVRSFYLKALEAMDAELPVDELSRRLQELAETDSESVDVKHIREERRMLERLVGGGKAAPHRFLGCRRPRMVMLCCEPEGMSVLADSLRGESAQTPWGIRLMHRPGDRLEENRLYDKMLFQLRMRKGEVLTPQTMGEGIASSELLAFCREVFDGEERYTFRLTAACLPGETADVRWVKQSSFVIEEQTKGQMKNDRENPQIELYVFPRRDGGYMLYAGIPQVGQQRFSYRRHVEPTSMAPLAAARMAAMCRPYMKEHVRVLDPLCGVGTLLIERNKICAAVESCGVELFGRAVDGARENTAAAGLDIRYTNRDYFEYSSKRPFDEIITEFPRFLGENRGQADAFYRRFFSRTAEIAAADAWLFLLSGEEGMVKKYIRLTRGFSLERQMEFRPGERVYIIRKRG